MNKTTGPGFQVEDKGVSYSLSEEPLAAYHRLLDKKFSEGLTTEEEVELDRVGSQLDDADQATPLEQANAMEANEEHSRRLATLDQVITLLKSLRSEG